MHHKDIPLRERIIFALDVDSEDLANAERFLLRALQADPNYAAAHLLLGQVYVLQNNRPAAYRAFQKAVSLSTDEGLTARARRLIETYFP